MLNNFESSVEIRSKIIIKKDKTCIVIEPESKEGVPPLKNY